MDKQESRTLNVGNGTFSRILALGKKYGVQTVSLLNASTDTEYSPDGKNSDEFNVMIDGKMVSGSDPELVLRDVSVENNGSIKRTKLELAKDGLVIELLYTCYGDMPVIRKSITLRNTNADMRFQIGGIFASEHMAVRMTPSMKAVYVNGITDPLSPNVYSYLDYGLEERALEPGIKRVFTNRMPRDMSHMQQWRRGKVPAVNHSNFSYFPWITLWDPDGGEGMFFGLEWSGPWRVELSPDDAGDACLLTVSMGDDFCHTLLPGESIAGLDLFEGVFTGGPEEAGIETQKFFDTYLAAASAVKKPGEADREPFSLPPVCWNTWLAFKTDIDEKMMLKQADMASELGFEVFVVDYGWSISAGDRHENLKCFPSGMKKISDYVKSLGMKFGLWVAITPLDLDTAPTEDPYKWLAITEEGTAHDEENIAGKCACLASGYKEYFESELDRIITEYQVDWFKYDQNIFIECFAKDHRHQNNIDSLYYQVKAFYEVLDHIHSKHPGLIIENALSGGMILDYGILQRAHTTFLHDDFRTYFIRRFFHGSSYPLPPSYSSTPSWAQPSKNIDPSAGDLDERKDQLSRRRFFDYFYRSSIMGACSISDDLIRLPKEAYDSLKRVLELYKNVRRRIKGPIRHILPQPRDPREWDAAEVYDDRSCEGMVFIFRPSSPVSEIIIRLRGLDKDKTYTFYSENQQEVIRTLNGKEAMEAGIRINIAENTGSEILHFRAINKAVEQWKEHNIKMMVGKDTYATIPSQMQIVTETWNRVAAVPFIAYMPEIDRLLMLVSCDYPHRGMISYSDDRGGSWSEPEYIHADSSGVPINGLCAGLTYLGNGKAALMNEQGEIGFSYDYGSSWKDFIEEPLAFGEKSRGCGWDPFLVDRDPAAGGVKQLITAGHITYGNDYFSPGFVSQGFIRRSNDSGRTWSSDIAVPQWEKVNETALIRAANGDLVAACRTDIQEKYRGMIDHYEGLGISISHDDGYTWSDVDVLYDHGRHHPSMVLLPDGMIVMSYVVRLGYPDTDDGFKRFGVEAVVSYDNGSTWDLDRRYILAEWQANRKGGNYWWGSCQATSTVLLPDGYLLTAFGTGYRSQPDENGLPAPRDAGLVRWKLKEMQDHG